MGGRRWRARAALSAIAVITVMANAEEYVWTGNGSNFFDERNWSSPSGGYPGRADHARVPVGDGTTAVSFGQAPVGIHTVRSLEFESGTVLVFPFSPPFAQFACAGEDAVTFALAIGTDPARPCIARFLSSMSSAVRFEARSLVVGSVGGTDGVIETRGTGTFDLDVEDIAVIGDAGSGRWEMTNNALFRAKRLVLGNQATGLGLVDVLDGADVRIEESLVVGSSGSGTLHVQERALMRCDGNVALGTQHSGDGTVVVSGDDAALRVDGHLDVGYQGHGVLDVREQAETIVLGSLFLATAAPPQQDAALRSVNVQSGAALTVYGDVIMGLGGASMLRMDDDAVIEVGGSIIVGDSTASTLEFRLRDAEHTPRLAIDESLPEMQLRATLEPDGALPPIGTRWTVVTAGDVDAPVAMHLDVTTPGWRLELQHDAQLIDLLLTRATDLNGDLVVDFTDLLALLDAWGACAPTPCPGDIDEDGIIGVTDLIQLLAEWGGDA